MRRAFILVLLLAACGGDEPAPTPAPEAPPEQRAATTAFGSWTISWHAVPDPIPLNEPFEIRATVTDAASAVVEHAALSIDASMPQHGHGMNRQPEIEHVGDEWIARGMLFHMPGSWELAFDVTADGVTERAAVEVVLE